MPPEFCVVDDWRGKNEALCQWSPQNKGKGNSHRTGNTYRSPAFKRTIDNNSVAGIFVARI